MKKNLRLHVETLRILQTGRASKVAPGTAVGFETAQGSCDYCYPGIITERDCFR